MLISLRFKKKLSIILKFMEEIESHVSLFYLTEK